MTGNIIGESINKYVQDQISQRQKTHGSGFEEERSLEDINYLNSNTSWVKMVSSVEINSDSEQLDAKIPEGKKRISDLGLDIDKYSGISLAKSAILFNSLSQANFKEDNTFSNYTFGSGYNTDSNNPWNTDNSYGLGGLEFGIQPPPGIKSFKVNHLNRGSIRKGEIHIKAYNKVQFEIIELLYLRLGFTMFIEWGNSIYIDKEGNRSNVTNTLIEDFWFNNGSTSENYETLLKKINDKRKSYDGNYDGFCGRVVNFNWTFAPDGSYDINIELASLGDVIESLTINNFYYNKKYQQNPDGNSATNIISSFLNSQREIVEIKTLAQTFNEVKNANRRTKIKDKIKKIKEGELREEIKEYGEYNSSCVSFTRLSIEKKFNDRWWVNGDQPNEDYGYFIKFGAFLNFIQQNVLPRISKDKKPILNIKNDPDSNFMYCNPMQFAIDPRVCFVRNDYLPKFANKDFDTVSNNSTSTTQNIKDINNYFNPWLVDLDNQFLGSIMDVYLNFAFIETLLKNLQEKNTGKIRLFTFLQSICEGINKSLGGLNKLEPVIDEDSNSITFIDSALDPSPLLSEINESGSSDNTFELYGYNPTNNSSNFVKDFNFQTEISPKFATMLTIGATSVGSVVGEDATAFSKWNEGLKDRYNPKVLEPKSLSDFQKNEKSKDNEFKILSVKQKKALKYGPRQQYARDLSKFNTEKRLKNETEYNRSHFAGYLTECFGGYITSPKGFKNIPRRQAKYADFDDPNFVERGYTVIRNNIENTQKQLQQSSGEIQSTIGFIPVRLSLTIDGLSGIKIYNKLIFNTKFLPSNYPDSLDFLVTQVNHELENNNWITKLETISVPKQNKVSIKDILEREGKVFIIPDGDDKRIPVADLKPSDGIYRFIASKESFRPQPYDDLNPNKILTPTSKIEGKLTIGYGTTVIPFGMFFDIFNSGEKFKSGEVKIGYVVNEPTAFNFLKNYIIDSEKIIKSWLKVPLTQDEYDAIISFTYNTGPGSGNKSTFVNLLNKKDYTGAGNSLQLYNKSKDRVIPGLVSRRKDEFELWMRNNPGNPK